MGIRSEIKDVIKLYSGCIVDHHEALAAIAKIVHRDKPPKPPVADTEAIDDYIIDGTHVIHEIFVISK